MNFSSELLSLRHKTTCLRNGQGFTLLELMIVLLVVGVLTGIALPSMIRQVGKARESEAVNNLSSIAFAQQGYFFEHRKFANDYATLGVGISPTNYNYPPPESPPGALRTQSRALSIDSGLTGSRDYAIGVYYSSTAYIVVLCQGAELGTTTEVPSDPSGVCTDGGVRIE